MITQARASMRTIETATLRNVLEQGLTHMLGAGGRIIRLQRRPSAYCTSHAIEELDAHFENGTALQVLFKNLSRHGMLPDARKIKPAFLYDPMREIKAYLDILEPGRLETAACYGVIADPRLDRFGLLLEKVPGRELYQVGEFAIWQQVARWLANMHRHFATGSLPPAAHLLQYDGDFYRLWLRRAQALSAKAERSQQRRAGRAIERLAGHYHQVVERLQALPATFIHGDFYPSNILVHERVGGLRVCPVDWEMAAIGPGLVDLAAFTAGKWTGEKKDALALAYLDALAGEGAEPEKVDAFLEALDYCRLHLALQWLGWSRDWAPPPEHSQNWLSELLRLMDKLGL